MGITTPQLIRVLEELACNTQFPARRLGTPAAVEAGVRIWAPLREREVLVAVVLVVDQAMGLRVR